MKIDRNRNYFPAVSGPNGRRSKGSDQAGSPRQDVAEDVLGQVETVLDDRLAEVEGVHRDRFQLVVGDAVGAVEDGVVHGEADVAGQEDGEFRGLGGYLVDGLVDGHGLGPLGDALAGREVRVGPRHRDLAREAAEGEGAYHRLGLEVARGDDAVHGDPLGEEAVQERVGLLAVGRLGPIVFRDGDLAFGDEGGEDLHDALVGHAGDGVVPRAVVDDDGPRADLADDGPRLELPDAFAVVGQVEVGARVPDHALVEDHRHRSALGFLDRVGEPFGIARDEHERVDASVQEVGDLGVLGLGILLSDLEVDVGSQGGGGGHEDVPVAGPAFLDEGIHHEAEEGTFALAEGALGPTR